MRLVTAWLAHRKSTQGESAAASARYLAGKLGKLYTSSRMWEWENNKRSMPEEVARLMRDELLPALMEAEGVDADHQRSFLRILETLLD